MSTTGAVPPDWVQRFGLPAVIALIQVGGTIGASQDQTDRKALDVLAFALLLAGPAALAVLRRRPLELSLLTMAVTVTYFVAGYPYGPVFLSLAVSLYWLIGVGQRTAGWLIAGGGLVAAVTLQAQYGRGPSWSMVHTAGVAGWLITVLLVAEAGRARRERVAEAQRVRAEEHRRRASEERLRIAQELHDVLAHNISLINVQAGVGLHLMDDQPAKARDALVAIKQASKDALGELRSVLDLLRGTDEAAPRAPTVGLDQLDRVIANAAAAGVAVDVETEGDQRPLPPEVDLAALRITQEALTNVTRHANASHARVRLCFEPDQLLLEVQDDGRGPANGIAGGNGIPGMRERAAALGGTLDAGPAAEGGFRVTARLPTCST